jgi:hypothetical protein
MHSLDRVFVEPEIKREYGGPKVPIIVDANIVVIKTTPDAFNLAHCLLI